MDAAGAQEVMMPSLQPRDLWEETGRSEAFGETLASVERFAADVRALSLP